MRINSSYSITYDANLSAMVSRTTSVRGDFLFFIHVRVPVKISSRKQIKDSIYANNILKKKIKSFQELLSTWEQLVFCQKHK